MTTFDRKTFYDSVRGPLFQGTLSQQQVDGMNAKLLVWETSHRSEDISWLAYCLATAKHETASTMSPVEEYGRGAGKPYGVPVAETGYAYYGRGDVQLTWDYNYRGAAARLQLTNGPDDLYWHPDKALDPQISADVMFRGMIEGWFRSPNSLDDFFSATKDDPYNARDIVNGDKKTVPSWSNGVSIGNLIKGYHASFLSALKASAIETPAPEPEPDDDIPIVELAVTVSMSQPVELRLIINGELVTTSAAPLPLAG